MIKDNLLADDSEEPTSCGRPVENSGQIEFVIHEDLGDSEPNELTGEVEVVTNCEEDEDEIINLGESNPEESAAPEEDDDDDPIEDDDDDPGYEIVTEDKGTNCPSLNGSLRKIPRLKSKTKKELDIIEVDEESAASLPPPAPKRQIKRWSKLMKYTLPSKTPEVKTKKSKERKSLKDKMKENDFVVFLTERRAVSESRFRVLDKVGSTGKLTRTKLEHSVDDSWNTGISTGTIQGRGGRLLKTSPLIGQEVKLSSSCPITML